MIDKVGEIKGVVTANIGGIRRCKLGRRRTHSAHTILLIQYSQYLHFSLVYSGLLWIVVLALTTLKLSLFLFLISYIFILYLLLLLSFISLLSFATIYNLDLSLKVF